MKSVTIIIILSILLLTASLTNAEFKLFARANPEGEFPHLSMPVEYINYTITDISGSLWAKIDGHYPIFILNAPTCSMLSLVYPMPPDSTDIHVVLNGEYLRWSNYTSVYPQLLHRTAIGDWWMIYTVLENISDSFNLEIHYSHPLEKVNGSCIFLYDLNIIDYLSEEAPTSTAYFTILFEKNPVDIQVYTAPVESKPNQWQPKEFTMSQVTSGFVVLVEMNSTYDAPLSGDLVVVFTYNDPNEAEPQNHYLSWVLTVIVLVVSFFIILFLAHKTSYSKFSSRKTTA